MPPLPHESPPPGRAALDRLDAYLEALWDGTAEPDARPGVEAGAGPGAEEPERPPAEGEDDPDGLHSWALDRLRRLPRTPRDDFVRRVGGLLTEFRGRRGPWNAAALRLLDDPYTFVAAGPRRHRDWADDVRAVMRRSVRDPRGWIRLDRDRLDDVRHSFPDHPFDPLAIAELPARLHPVGLDTAVAALAVMSEEWQAEPAPVRSRPSPDRARILADARTLLDRYGPAAGLWTNATGAADGASPDFVAAGLAGTRSHRCATTEYVKGLDIVDDLGVIAVNEDEVGVFWSFGAC
ncbi:hypothetical protein ACF1BN_07550 [Streptomyces sp. NPDC014861]|uniref:hypothetical protein n=1 Tax=Streptomyces sp. NPDC014861 TaxID=3364923 RepID=UPI0036FDC2A4